MTPTWQQTDRARLERLSTGRLLDVLAIAIRSLAWNAITGSSPAGLTSAECRFQVRTVRKILVKRTKCIKLER
jgi:hypothetical protein